MKKSNNQQLLKDNKHFCMAPWVHLSTWQTGDTYPCCAYDYETPIGNVNQEGFKGVWNNEKMKELRLAMLADKATYGCRKCFDYEKQGVFSYRHKMNNDYGHHIDSVEQTKEDGTVDNLNIAFFDVRFSNLCNMKCRSCGSHFSSRWAEDEEGKARVVEIDYPHLWDEIEEILPTVEEIYFTGGESLFMKQHYDLLDRLIELEHFPKLMYNSNASRLHLKDRHVKDYWKYFDDIIFGVSLDQVGDKANYTRHGQKWETVFENLCWIRDNVPHVKIIPSPTISVLNIMDIDKILVCLYDNNLASDYEINLNNLLVTPEYLSCTILPRHLKKQAEKNIKKALDSLGKYPMNSSRLKNISARLEKIIEYMYSEDNSHLILEFQETTKKLDTIRNENFAITFPELKEIYE